MNLKRIEWLPKDYDGLFEKQVPSQLLQNPLLQKNIWRTIEDLGLETHEHQKILTVNFTKIQPSWLNLLTKLYVLKKASLKLSIQYIKDDFIYFRKFAKFLKEQQINNIKHINNDLFEQFDCWIRLTRVSERTISLHHTTLENLFNTCRQEGWLDIDTYWFRGRKVQSKPKNDEIDYIPEEVWNQLEENLHYFPEPMQRKVLIIRTLGLRIGELLNLPFDCLRKRGSQWRLRLKETEKFEVEGDEMPLPCDLVPVIKEQQEYIRENFGASYKKLFCSNNGGKNSERDLPYLQQDLERLKDELEKADKLGMVRVVKEIQKDINYLQIRINALKT